MTAPPSPADLLLRASARVRIDAARRERIGELVRSSPPELDWPKFLATVRSHAVTPLVHRALEREPAVPAEARAQLARDFFQGAAANLLLARELARVLALLEDAGIGTFVHKGLGIAAQAYGDLSLRHTGDLDLYVRQPDLPRARTVLAASGGYEGAHEPAPDHYHLTMRQPASGIKVELHWAFTRDRWPFVIPADLLWPHVHPVPSEAGPLPCLDPAVNVLALCAHGAKETWSRHGLIVDLAELLDRFPALDWEWTLAQAAAIGRLEPVLTGLALAGSLAGAALPEPAARALRECEPAAALARRLGRHPLGDPQPDELRDAVRAPLRPEVSYRLKQPFRRLRKLLWPGDPQ